MLKAASCTRLPLFSVLYPILACLEHSSIKISILLSLPDYHSHAQHLHMPQAETIFYFVCRGQNIVRLRPFCASRSQKVLRESSIFFSPSGRMTSTPPCMEQVLERFGAKSRSDKFLLRIAAMIALTARRPKIRHVEGCPCR